MATDILGWRARIGIVAPATNTVVQPEMEMMRPEGVTNHHGRIRVTNVPMAGDEDFLRLLDALDADMDRALKDVSACAPDHLIVGVTSPMLRGGRDACAARLNQIEAQTGIAATAGSMALCRILRELGIRRIGLVTPYAPVMDDMLTMFFEEDGMSVASLVTLRCPTPFAIAEVPHEKMQQKVETADTSGIEAWVQVGTNLPFTALAASLTQDLDKPVIGVNAATYWEALRRIGVSESVPALGQILSGLAMRRV